MSQTLQPTAADVRAVAHQLLTWADELAAPGPLESSPRDAIARCAAAVREVLRCRARTFPHLRLHEPLWDVMLDLFIHHEDGSPASLEHLVAQGDAEAAVVRHAVAVLVTTGLVARTADRSDADGAWFALTPAGHAGMVEHFTEVVDCMRPALHAADRTLLVAA